MIGWIKPIRFIGEDGSGGVVPPAFDPAVALQGQQYVRVKPSPATCFTDVARTTPASVGEAVAGLADISGNGWHLSQATAGNRPVLQQDESGKYYLEFNGATNSRFMQSAAINFAATDKLTTFSALRHGTATTAQCPYSLANVGVTGSMDVTSNTRNFSWAAHGTARVVVQGVDQFLFVENTAVIESCLYNIAGVTALDEVKPRVSSVPVNVTAPVPGPAGTGNFSNARVLRIGSRSDGQYFNGRIYELMMVGADVSAINADMETYLATDHALIRLVSLGDSTVARYINEPSVAALMSRSSPFVIATPGDTIAGQKAKWNAITSYAGMTVLAVQIGLNDLNPAVPTATTLAALQDLFTTIKVAVPANCKVYAAKMTPCKARLLSLYGASPGAVAYQKWLDLNDALAGTGPSPITGVDGRITAHEPLMNDGTGNLAAIYDTGDGIHPNTAGRQVNADAYRAKFVADGVA